MRERLPLEKLLLEIAEDEGAEKDARSRMVSQDEISNMVARRRSTRRTKSGQDAER